MIWESAFKEACPSFSSLEGLQSKLEEKLRRQKFFLVLDDIWCDKGDTKAELEQLFAPLRVGKRGSKILVTTRIEEAAKALGVMNPIPLRELDEDQFFSLFMSNALGDAYIRDKRRKEKLMSIGKKIATKLHRSPLAAKTVAAQLHRRLDVEFWSSMLNRSLLNDTMGALFFSYQHLPSPLQRCFAFCSLFPTGHEFEHDHLVNLWIAEGFIETKDTSEHLKDIGSRYILELVSCSFFQVDQKNTNVYSMHDLIHDLAQCVSQNECFKIECSEEKEIPTQTRHLYVVAHMIEAYMEKICKLKDLRTIVSSLNGSYICLREVQLDTLFMNLRKLYVVDIPHIESLSKYVVHLKNLRYLRIENIKQADAIPESINRLYQLRAFHIGKVYPFTGNQIEISDVGRLILLQDLREFHIRKRRGFELKQLEHLTNLFGSLSIYDLHHVESKEEANQAKLSEKKGLKKLSFNWDNENEDVLRDYDVEILDSLCPPPQIKQVTIKGYTGKRLPSWILENNDNIIHLKHLELVECIGLEALHKINELFDLQYLTIYSLPRLKSRVSVPLNLTQLEISLCLSLAFALKEDLEMIMLVQSKHISQIVTFSNNCNRYYYDPLSVDSEFTRVQEMIKLGNHIDEQTLSTILNNDLKGCLEKRLNLICQLKEIYRELYLPSTLEELKIKSCFITDNVLAGSLQGLNSLTHLRLWNIITITCITDEVLSSLISLVELEISGCLLFTSIGGWDTHSTLESLRIYCCPNLTLKASVLANRCNTTELASSSCKRKTTSSILYYIYLDACMPSDDCFQNLVSL